MSTLGHISLRAHTSLPADFFDHLVDECHFLVPILVRVAFANLVYNLPHPLNSRIDLLLLVNCDGG